MSEQNYWYDLSTSIEPRWECFTDANKGVLVTQAPVIYLIGSLRNPALPYVGNELRAMGFDVFDEWFAGGKIADDEWRDYEKVRGHSFGEALQTYYAKHIFEFDKFHIDRANLVVMLMPSGRSGHLELGYALGMGKKGFILFEAEPERYDVMYQFATGIHFSLEDLKTELRMHYPNLGGNDGREK